MYGVGLIIFFILLWIRYLLSRRKSPRKPLLILDMNNVLVARAFAPKLKEEFPGWNRYTDSAVLLGKHYTWKRPHLDKFLEHIFAHHQVAVWSSAWPENVNLLCNFVFGTKYRSQLLFEWSQEKCESIARPSSPKPLFCKNLSEVWKAFPEYNQFNTVIADDSLEKMQNNPKECVCIVPSWTPLQENDTILEFLMR